MQEGLALPSNDSCQFAKYELEKLRTSCWNSASSMDRNGMAPSITCCANNRTFVRSCFRHNMAILMRSKTPATAMMCHADVSSPL